MAGVTLFFYRRQNWSNNKKFLISRNFLKPWVGVVLHKITLTPSVKDKLRICKWMEFSNSKIPYVGTLIDAFEVILKPTFARVDVVTELAMKVCNVSTNKLIVYKMLLKWPFHKHTNIRWSPPSCIKIVLTKRLC